MGGHQTKEEHSACIRKQEAEYHHQKKMADHALKMQNDKHQHELNQLNLHSKIVICSYVLQNLLSALSNYFSPERTRLAQINLEHKIKQEEGAIKARSDEHELKLRQIESADKNQEYKKEVLKAQMYKESEERQLLLKLTPESNQLYLKCLILREESKLAEHGKRKSCHSCQEILEAEDSLELTKVD